MTNPPLRSEDPSSFSSRQVRIREIPNTILINPHGEAHSFSEMMKHRCPAPVEMICENLQGNGHVFANLGVSALIETALKGGKYLVLVQQDRRANKDFQDVVLKLLSGYLDARHFHNPHKAMMKEINEEFLMMHGDEAVPLSVGGVSYGRPYESLKYAAQRCDFKPSRTSFTIPGLSGKRVVLGQAGQAPTELDKTTKVYYHAPTNSAQIVFHYNVLLPEGVSLQHTEDRFNPATKTLDTHIHQRGMILIKQEAGRLTNQVFAYENGVLSRQDPTGLVLSEAFDEKVNSIGTRNNVPLEERTRQA